MKFVIATLHHMGLGFAARLQDEGHDVVLAHAGTDDRRATGRYHLVGCGIVPKRPLAELFAERAAHRDWYWIWDENHSVEWNETLRAEGFRVFGGGRYANTMEHDRDACLALVQRHGLKPPPSHAFDDPAAALRLVEANPDTAYVYKPDHGETFDTWLPLADDAAEANLELRQHLRSLATNGSFVLQERKEGVETNVEVWFVNGEPRFAFMTIESKRRLTGDLGDLAGCAFDFTFAIPVESRAVCETLGGMFDEYRRMRYTGFGDANVMIARDGIWFFEKCERFGYNAHPNLLWTLNRAPLGETFAALVEGDFTPDVAPGFGASVSMYMEHPAAGKAVHVPESVARGVYLVDVYREDGSLLTAGYNEVICYATAHGYTIPTAWEAAAARAWQVRFPGRSFRTDGGGTDYPSSPVRRFEALGAMGYL